MCAVQKCKQRTKIEIKRHTEMRLRDKARGHPVTEEVSEEYAWGQVCRAKQCCACAECDGLFPTPPCPSGYRTESLEIVTEPIMVSSLDGIGPAGGGVKTVGGCKAACDTYGGSYEESGRSCGAFGALDAARPIAPTHPLSRLGLSA